MRRAAERVAPADIAAARAETGREVVRKVVEVAQAILAGYRTLSEGSSRVANVAPGGVAVPLAAACDDEEEDDDDKGEVIGEQEHDIGGSGKASC